MELVFVVQEVVHILEQASYPALASPIDLPYVEEVVGIREDMPRHHIALVLLAQLVVECLREERA